MPIDPGRTGGELHCRLPAVTGARTVTNTAPVGTRPGRVGGLRAGNYPWASMRACSRARLPGRPSFMQQW